MAEREQKNIFAERLAQLLAEEGMSQAELARRTGLSKSTISHYVKGDWKGKQPAVYAIATALNCRVEWLQGLDDWMQFDERSDRADDLVDQLIQAVGYYFRFEDFGSKVYIEKTKSGFVPGALGAEGVFGGRIELSDYQALKTKILASVEQYTDELLRKGIEFELRKEIESLDSMASAAIKMNNMDGYRDALIKKDKAVQALMSFLDKASSS